MNNSTPSSTPDVSKDRVPLCVDLDGTLIRSDTMWEAMRWLAKRNPLRCLLFLVWWAGGRAHLKQQLAQHANLNVTQLPYHLEFIDWLRQQKEGGRTLILVTAADQAMGEKVAGHVKLFDEVIGSDGIKNLRGYTKRQHLTARFGKGQYDYAGNSSVDLQVWPDVRAAYVVNARAHIVEQVRQIARVEKVFP